MYFDGLFAETSLLETGTYPTLDEYMMIRETVLMIHPFMALKEVETQVVLPSQVYDHPLIRRLTSLAVRITDCFNEFQSYDKDAPGWGMSISSTFS